MLHTVTERVNGITVVRANAHFFTRSLSIRPGARRLRTRYNEVYSQSFDALKPANAHQVAEDAVVLVAEAVLNTRLAAYVEAKAPKQAAKRPARKTRDLASANRLERVVEAYREARRCGHYDVPELAGSSCAYDSMGACVL